MAELVFLSEEDVSRLLPLAELARSLSDALVALSEGKASVPRTGGRTGARWPAGGHARLRARAWPGFQVGDHLLGELGAAAALVVARAAAVGAGTRAVI